MYWTIIRETPKVFKTRNLLLNYGHVKINIRFVSKSIREVKVFICIQVGITYTSFSKSLF